MPTKQPFGAEMKLIWFMNETQPNRRSDYRSLNTDTSVMGSQAKLNPMSIRNLWLMIKHFGIEAGKNE
jgi:hypothetical protein